MNKKRTVLVTAIGSFSAEAAIGGCRREEFRVVGCDIYPAEWVANSREVDVFYQAPYATDQDAYRAFLLEVCSREQVDYLLPLTDVEVDVLHGWEDASKALGAVICMSGPETITLCRDKELLERFLAGRGVCRTIPGRRLSAVMKAQADVTEATVAEDSEGAAGDHGPENWRERKAVGAGLRYPLVIKPRDGRSSQGLRMVEDPEEFAFVARRLQNEADRYLVQEKISGRVVTVDVIRDPERDFCACLPRRELLRTLNGAGTSVQVFRDETLEQQCREIAAALDVRGCVNFEFIEQEGTGDFYFLECNPRFAGGVAFSFVAGYDMTRNHLRYFEGKRLEPMPGSYWTGSQYIARRYKEYWMKEEKNG